MPDQLSDVPSDYHDIVKPGFEKDPWDHDYYDFVDTVDTELIKKDTLANRPADPPAGSWYLATDESIFYRYDGTSWSVIGGRGDYDGTYVEKAGDTMSGDLNVSGGLDVGGVTVLGSGVVSQGNFNISGNSITEASAIGGQNDLLFRTGSTSSLNDIIFRDSSTGNNLAIISDDGNLDVPGGSISVSQEISTNGYNLFVQDTQPTAENVGDVWIDNSGTDANTKVWNGTDWVATVSGGAIALEEYATAADVPDPTTVTQPTIAYVADVGDGTDDYIGVFNA